MKKILFDFFPIVLFFITYKIYGFYAATVVVILATLSQIAIHWLRYRKLEKLHLITLAFVVVFGGATLIFNNELFFKWKPSILNWFLGLLLLGSQFVSNKNIAQRVMEKQFSLPKPIWTKLNFSWAIFLITLGFINLYIVYNFDTDTWVNFKLYGFFGITLLFGFLQAIYLSKHLQASQPS